MAFSGRGERHCIELFWLFVTFLCGCCTNFLILLALGLSPVALFCTFFIKSDCKLCYSWDLECCNVLWYYFLKVLCRTISHKILYILFGIITHILEFEKSFFCHYGHHIFFNNSSKSCLFACWQSNKFVKSRSCKLKKKK